MTKADKKALDALYKAWTGIIAEWVESQAHGLNYMVIVTRYTGRGKTKSSEYLFSTYIIASICRDYWRFRGGLVSLALCKVEDEWGYTHDPYDIAYP